MKVSVVLFIVIELLLNSLTNGHNIRKYKSLGKRFHVLDGVNRPARYSFAKQADLFFIQKVDHFDEDNHDTWNQRYWRSFQYENHTNPLAPIFLILGGEAEADDDLLFFTNNRNIANKFGAAVFILEHRYYGKSQPVEERKDLTKNETDVDDFLYLTSQQALKDAENFIRSMDKKYNKKHLRKWIAFGCSYPGNLAAWLRLHHPELVAGAIASSAPVQAILEYTEYFAMVVKHIGKNCTDNIRNTFMRFKEEMRSDEKREKFLKKMNIKALTEDFQHYEDVEELLAFLIQMIGFNVQNHNKREKILHRLCRKMKDPDYDKRIRALFQLYREKQVGDDGGADDNSWVYQQCNEFGFFLIYLPEIEFGEDLPLNHYTEDCMKIFDNRFGEKYIEEEIEKTNTLYGGKEFPGTNVMFINGAYDPWAPLSIHPHEVDRKRNIESIIVRHHAHCGDWVSFDDEVRKKTYGKINKFIDKVLKSKS